MRSTASRHGCLFEWAFQAYFEKEVVPIIPMGKLIQLEDIADTMLFLASEKAGMLMGQVIKVSGGHAL